MNNIKDVGLIYPMMTFDQFFEMMGAHGEHFEEAPDFEFDTDEYNNYWDQQYRMYVLAFEEGMV